MLGARYISVTYEGRTVSGVSLLYSGGAGAQTWQHHNGRLEPA